MIASLARLLDRSVLQIGYAMLPQSTWREAANERDLELEQAVQFLNGPDFIPAESQPAQLDFIPDTSGGRFRFPTPRPCEFAENNVVHGRLYRCADAWQERPVIILLHGGGDFPGHQLAFHLFARRCHRAGFNAATLELPYHFQRRPRQYGPLSILCQYSPLIRKSKKRGNAATESERSNDSMPSDLAVNLSFDVAFYSHEIPPNIQRLIAPFGQVYCRVVKRL